MACSQKKVAHCASSILIKDTPINGAELNDALLPFPLHPQRKWNSFWNGHKDVSNKSVTLTPLSKDKRVT
jgi:hypothetical protein